MSKKKEDFRPVSLSKYEIACVTAGVPATGDIYLDKIITQGLRFKTAAQILEGLLSSGIYTNSHSELTTIAIKAADSLIDEFRTGKNSNA